MKGTFLLDHFTDGTLCHVSALLRGPGDGSLGLTSTTCIEVPSAKCCLAWLVGSQFPDQGLSRSHDSESLES